MSAFKALGAQGNHRRNGKELTWFQYTKRGEMDPEYYRPIRLTSIPGKRKEKKNKWRIGENKVITRSQHRVLPCQTNLIDLFEKVIKLVDQ